MPRDDEKPINPKNEEMPQELAHKLKRTAQFYCRVSNSGKAMTEAPMKLRRTNSVKIYRSGDRSTNHMAWWPRRGLRQSSRLPPDKAEFIVPHTNARRAGGLKNAFPFRFTRPGASNADG